MAETTTTKQAGGWKPPRLSILSLGSTDSGNRVPTDPATIVWEYSPESAHQKTCGYRMPTSSETEFLPYCQ